MCQIVGERHYITLAASIEEKTATDQIRRIKPVDAERYNVVEGHRRADVDQRQKTSYGRCQHDRENRD